MHLRLLRRSVRLVGTAVLDLLTEPRCAGCGAAGASMCGPCRAGLERVPGPGCPRCGEPVAAGAQCPDPHAWLAGIARAVSPLRYRGTGGALVRRLKFEHDLGAGAHLVRAMTAALWGWAQGEGRRARLVSVPLHPSKRRARGFDQAAWLASEVARALRRTCLAGALVRRRATLPQGDPRVTSRAVNVAGAFAVRRVRAVRGAVIVLVDDVTTSGETARECARVLREAGAARVVLLTATRAR